MTPYAESLRDALAVFESLRSLEPKVVEAAELVLACLKSGR
jgi:hypothetical protein